jgi:hypothetical protein
MPSAIHLLCTLFTRRMAGHFEAHPKPDAAYPLDNWYAACFSRELFRNARIVSNAESGCTPAHCGVGIRDKS